MCTWWESKQMGFHEEKHMSSMQSYNDNINGVTTNLDCLYDTNKTPLQTMTEPSPNHSASCHGAYTTWLLFLEE